MSTHRMGMIDYAKELAELVKKYNDQELYEKIVSLREYLLQLREENLALKQRIKELELAEEISDRLVRKWNCYVLKDDLKQHPYCLVCWDSDRKLISLNRAGSRAICLICTSRGGK